MMTTNLKVEELGLGHIPGHMTPAGATSSECTQKCPEPVIKQQHIYFPAIMVYSTMCGADPDLMHTHACSEMG